MHLVEPLLDCGLHQSTQVSEVLPPGCITTKTECGKNESHARDQQVMTLSTNKSTTLNIQGDLQHGRNQ